MDRIVFGAPCFPALKSFCDFARFCHPVARRSRYLDYIGAFQRADEKIAYGSCGDSRHRRVALKCFNDGLLTWHFQHETAKAANGFDFHDAAVANIYGALVYVDSDLVTIQSDRT